MLKSIYISKILANWPEVQFHRVLNDNRLENILILRLLTSPTQLSSIVLEILIIQKLSDFYHPPNQRVPDFFHPLNLPEIMMPPLGDFHSSIDHQNSFQTSKCHMTWIIQKVNSIFMHYGVAFENVHSLGRGHVIRVWVISS